MEVRKITTIIKNKRVKFEPLKFCCDLMRYEWEHHHNPANLNSEDLGSRIKFCRYCGAKIVLTEEITEERKA